jgi:hypothetical protein
MSQNINNAAPQVQKKTPTLEPFVYPAAQLVIDPDFVPMVTPPPLTAEHQDAPGAPRRQARRASLGDVPRRSIALLLTDDNIEEQSKHQTTVFPPSSADI